MTKPIISLFAAAAALLIISSATAAVRGDPGAGSSGAPTTSALSKDDANLFLTRFTDAITSKSVDAVQNLLADDHHRRVFYADGSVAEYTKATSAQVFGSLFGGLKTIHSHLFSPFVHGNSRRLFVDGWATYLTHADCLINVRIAFVFSLNEALQITEGIHIVDLTVGQLRGLLTNETSCENLLASNRVIDNARHAWLYSLSDMYQATWSSADPAKYPPTFYTDDFQGHVDGAVLGKAGLAEAIRGLGQLFDFSSIRFKAYQKDVVGYWVIYRAVMVARVKGTSCVVSADMGVAGRSAADGRYVEGYPFGLDTLAAAGMECAAAQSPQDSQQQRDKDDL